MSKKEPHVCFVVNSLNQKDPLYDLVPALHEYTNIDRMSIIAWFNYSSEVTFFEEYADVLHLDADRSMLGIGWKGYKKAMKVIDKCDIIQTNTTPAEIHGKLLGLIQRTPIVHREGNVLHEYTPEIRISRFISNLFTDEIICVSDAVADSFGTIENGFLKNKKRVIYNGVRLDLEKEASEISFQKRLNIPESSVKVCVAASLTEQKGYDILIKAIDKANGQTSKDIHLLIAGDGKLRQELQELVTEIKISDKVHFLGLLSRRDLYALINESDIFAMPSRYEGFSVSVIQAMALKKPCILTDIKSFNRYFDNSAVFVPVDNVERLSDAIASLSVNDEKKRYYGNAGYEKVSKKYSDRKMAQEYEQVYRSILSEY